MLYDFKKVNNQICYGSFRDNAQRWLERSNVEANIHFWNKCLKLTNLKDLISQSLPNPGYPYVLFPKTA